MKLQTTTGEVFKVDKDVYEKFKHKKFYRLVNKYKGTERIYIQFYFEGKKSLLHRVIMNAEKGQLVDHSDGDTLNNFRSNLRIASKSENCANRYVSNGNSKFKGVHYCKTKNKYRAAITKDGIKNHIGFFKDEELAAEAYDEKAIELHGKFAKTNSDLGLI